MKVACVTIAIPYYSGLEYLRSSIESVLAQDLDRWRLVVCDDSPGDNSQCEILVRNIGDARVSYSANPRRLGIPGNWNRCLDVATTEYVTLLHADDRLLPNYLSTMLQAAEQFPDAVALACPAIILNHRGQKNLSLKRFVKAMYAPRSSEPIALSGETALRRLLKANFIVCPSLCYRTDYATRHPFDPQWTHVADLAWTTGALLDDQSILYVPSPVFAHRDHANCATQVNTRSLIRFQELVRLYQSLQQTCLSRGWQQAATVAEQKHIVKKTLLFCTFEDIITFRWKQALQKIKAGISIF